MDFTKEHEAQNYYHKWCALSCVASALSRRVWVKLGFGKLYPNLYIILVGPPGAARKGATLDVAIDIMNMAKRQGIINTIAESITHREIHDALQEAKTEIKIDGSHYTYMSATVVSAELESFIKLDDRKLVVALTDLFDCRDEHRYHTHGKGKVDLENVCLNILGGTVPDFISSASRTGSMVGTGFTSRCIFLYAKSRKMNRMFPPVDIDTLVYLADGLCKIGTLKGQIPFTEDATNFIVDWYEKKMKIPENALPQMLPFYERKQAHTLKVAMLRAAIDTLEGNAFCINIEHLKKAIEDVTEAEPYMAAAFKGVGKSDEYSIINSICAQLEQAKDAHSEHLWLSKSDIFHENIADATPQMIQITLDTLIGSMRVVDTQVIKGQQHYKWKGRG
jgi:hypothetical protein